MSKLRINSIDEVDEILEIAIDLRDNTPNSFYILAHNLNIFNYGSPNLQKLYEEFNPDKMLALPIFSSELLTITYKDLIGCPDENCQNFCLKDKNFEIKVKCNFCRTKNIKPKLFYIIFDLRLFDNNNKKNGNKYISTSFPGFLPKTVTLTKEDFEDITFPKNILNVYSKDKENVHFIIMTSNTDDFDKYEEEFYIRKKNDKRGSKVGIFYKVLKELNKKKAEELRKKSENKYNLLMEYNNFKNLVEAMNEEGFKYVSFIYGGYKNVHSLAMKYNIELLEHQENCFLCMKEKKNSFEKIINGLKFFKK